MDLTVILYDIYEDPRASLLKQNLKIVRELTLEANRSSNETKIYQWASVVEELTLLTSNHLIICLSMILVEKPPGTLDTL